MASDTPRRGDRAGDAPPGGATAEDLKGRAKEALGALTGRDDLREEGKAQQQKAEKLREAADMERTAARKAAEADRARAEADSAEADQRLHRR